MVRKTVQGSVAKGSSAETTRTTGKPEKATAEERRKKQKMGTEGKNTSCATGQITEEMERIQKKDEPVKHRFKIPSTRVAPMLFLKTIRKEIPDEVYKNGPQPANKEAEMIIRREEKDRGHKQAKESRKTKTETGTIARARSN